MAQWVYLYKITESYSTAVSVTAPVSAFPVYDTTTQAYTLTEQSKGSGFGYKCYDSPRGALWIKTYVEILVPSPSLGKSVTIFQSIYHEAASAYKGSTNEVVPNKLLRVETTANLSTHGTVYTDQQISGRYIIRSTGATLPQACFVPVKFSVGGTLYDGVGNYNSTYFKYYTSSEDEGGATQRLYNFFTNTTAMLPTYLTKNTNNKVGQTEIAVGDIIDFGSEPQNVPSCFINWLNSCAEDITDSAVSEPIDIPVTTTKGVRLYTGNRWCPFDINIIPTLEEKTATENGEYTPSKGFAGFSKFIVDVPEVPEWDGSFTKLITFTIDGAEYQAESGMTWAEWVESDYNTITAYVSDSYVCGATSGYYICNGPDLSFKVMATETIDTNVAYYLTNTINAPGGTNQ